MSLFLEKNVDIKFHLNNQDFDGPFDLLLTLVNTEEIDISEIFVSDITQQYVDYVTHMEVVDYDYAAEFVAMAARLLYIKAEKVLPRLDDGTPTAEDEFYEDLRAYQEEYRVSLMRIMKEGAEKLEEKEILYRFYREPQFTEKDYRVVINDFNLEKMIQAFSDILEKIEKREELEKPKTVIKERETVGERAQLLVDILRKRTRVRFSTLFDDDYTKEDVINTFLALLLLLKKQYATVEQEGEFGDIIINIVDNEENGGETNEQEFEEYN